jgi:hypothetical protein
MDRGSSNVQVKASPAARKKDLLPGNNRGQAYENGRSGAAVDPERVVRGAEAPYGLQIFSNLGEDKKNVKNFGLDMSTLVM